MPLCALWYFGKIAPCFTCSTCYCSERLFKKKFYKEANLKTLGKISLLPSVMLELEPGHRYQERRENEATDLSVRFINITFVPLADS